MLKKPHILYNINGDNLEEVMKATYLGVESMSARVGNTAYKQPPTKLMELRVFFGET